MSYFINTKQKVAKDKEIDISIKNAIYLKLGETNVQSLPYSSVVYDNDNPNIKIVYLSTWNIKCGIATYTSYLLNNINKLCSEEIAGVFPIVNKDNMYKIERDIVHIQHEFGIMPKRIETNSKVIITFHAVHKNPKYVMKQIENNVNVVGYIAHSKVVKDVLSANTKKDVYLISHGSEIIKLDKQYNTKASIRKALNLDKLGITDEDKCAFAFGFQSGDKNFNSIIEACKNTNIKLIISGAKHECEYTNKLISYNKKNVIFLNKFLDDTEINMFSSACDLLIFDYVSQKHYSCSGAMHRVIGSGNPVICSRINHFNDIIENKECLKFNGQKELELKIKKALENFEEYSKKSLEYSNKTSWENVAKQHLDVYLKCMNAKDDVIESDDIENTETTNNINKANKEI